MRCVEMCLRQCVRHIVVCGGKPKGQVELIVIAGGCAAEVEFNCDYIFCCVEQEVMWIYSW